MVNYFLRVLSETHGCHHQEDTRLKLQFVANTDHSIHAGLVVVEAMARRFDLWRKLGKLACLNPRKDKKCGFGPEVIVGQLIYALCSGGGCLSDSEALNDDPLARELFGVGKFADQSQVGEWLREQSGESVAALRQLLHQFVAWVWQQAEPRRQPQGCERSTPAHARTQLFPLEGKGSALLRRQQEQHGRLPEGHRRRRLALHRELQQVDRPAGPAPFAALGADRQPDLLSHRGPGLRPDGAIKLLDLNDDCQGWRIKTLMKKLVMLPGRMGRRSRQWVARVLVPGAWLCW